MKKVTPCEAQITPLPSPPPIPSTLRVRRNTLPTRIHSNGLKHLQWSQERQQVLVIVGILAVSARAFWTTIAVSCRELEASTEYSRKWRSTGKRHVAVCNRLRAEVNVSGNRLHDVYARGNIGRNTCGWNPLVQRCIPCSLGKLRELSINQKP